MVPYRKRTIPYTVLLPCHTVKKYSTTYGVFPQYDTTNISHILYRVCSILYIKPCSTIIPFTNIWYHTNCVCVFFTLKYSFYPSTSSTTSARADYSILEEILLYGHKTTSQRYYVATYAVSTAVGNTMPCHYTGYDRHAIHILWNRETKGNKEENKNKEDKSNEKSKLNKKE